MRAIAEADPDIWCSVGAHPHEAADHADLLPERLAALTAHPKVVGIGETGLDYHYDLSPRDIQERVFRAHIAASHMTGLPLIIHAREADDDIARILREERPLPGVMHCFSSGRALAEAALELGFFISISGIATFKNAEDLRAIVRDVPLDRLLVETDSPYLAPVPYRGKRNEPAFVKATAAAVAVAERHRTRDVGGGDHRQFLPPVRQGETARRDSCRAMRVTVLGCGASTGVPAIGPNWGQCDPTDPRNRRRRVSLLVEIGAVAILIDTSPDLREQLIDARVRRLDAVLMTHPHADHLHGIDDIRQLNRMMKAAIPLWADARTLDEIGSRFGYALAAPSEPGQFYKPTLEPNEITGPFSVAGIPVVPFAQDHGFSTTLGFRIGAMAYSTDVTELDEAAFAAIAGIELWIVDCMRRAPHPTHSHLEKTLGWIKRVRPRRAVLTHMDQSLDYRALAAELPEGVEPGQDGLVIDLPDPA